MILKLISTNFHKFLLDSLEQVSFLEIFEAKVLHFVDLSYLSAQHIRYLREHEISKLKVGTY